VQIQKSMPVRKPWMKIHMAQKRFNISDGLVVIASLYIGFIVLCALIPQWIAPFPPSHMFADAVMQPPGPKHWLGTDYFGRDMFSMIVYGSRQSVIIGSVSVLFAGIAGGFIGAIAGYAGGVIDMIFMRIIDIIMTIPGILLALAIAAALGPNLANIIIAVGIALIPNFARVMRGQVISIRSRSFIEAARSIGTSHPEIFFRHVLPNSMSPLLVMATIGVGAAILIGSALSFLGLGTTTGEPDWGTILAQGRGYITVAWWIVTFPGLTITMLVLAVNMIGDVLRDALDPRHAKH